MFVTMLLADLHAAHMLPLRGNRSKRHAHATILTVRRVSKRSDGEDVVRDAAIMQRTMNRLRGVGLIPRGVYRFARHEEADEWMTRTIADTHAHLSSKTSSRSAKR
jgi:hypothetical protein